MAFPSDTANFQLIGTKDAPRDTGVYTQVNVGVIIGPDENAALVKNAHSLWTNSRRAVVASWVTWGLNDNWVDQEAVVESTATSLTEVARQPIHVSVDRDSYTVKVDSEGADWTVTLYNATTASAEDTVSHSGSASREWTSGTLTRAGADTDDYQIIFEMERASGQPTAYLWALTVYEDATPT